MQTFELIIGLLAVVVGLVWLSDRYRVPYPMVLMAGGLLLAVLPRTPNLELDPEIVLVVFLPPILFQAAQRTSLRDFRVNFGSISRLAVGLVILTAAVVAVVAHAAIPGIGWAAAFTLGAIVSPPDDVAATAIFQRLGAPRRIVSILEGESLINDASAIVLYTFAVAAVVTGRFSMGDALLEFVVVVVVGVLVGGLVGRVAGRLIMILDDSSLVTLTTLIIPAATYVLARGPFTEADDRALMQAHRIEILVCRNSGGDAAYGKIAAARALGLPVVLIARPPLPEVAASRASVAEAVAWLDHALPLRGE